MKKKQAGLIFNAVAVVDPSEHLDTHASGFLQISISEVTRFMHGLMYTKQAANIVKYPRKRQLQHNIQSTPGSVHITKRQSSSSATVSI